MKKTPRKYWKKNPRLPRYTSENLKNQEDILKYILKHYNLRIDEDKNLQKILDNIEKIQYISSGSESDVFKIRVRSKIFLNDDYKSKTVLFPNNTYALKIGFVSRQCLHHLKILSKFGLTPKIYYSTMYFVVMEYINGPNLKDFISMLGKKFDHADEDERKILTQILDDILDQKHKILKNVEKVYKYNEISFYSLDIHNENFIVQISSNKLFFIDACI